MNLTNWAKTSKTIALPQEPYSDHIYISTVFDMLTLWLKPAKAIGPLKSGNLAESCLLLYSTFWQTLTYIGTVDS